MNPSEDRVAEFQRLHSSGCFVMPNPWDVGSARALAQLGFPALATTSAGFAWTVGRADTHVGLDRVLDHLRDIADAVAVPVIASGGAGTLEHFAEVVEQAGVDAVLAASVFHFRTFSVRQVKEFLAGRGIPVRL